MTMTEINTYLEAMIRFSRISAQKSTDYSDKEALSLQPLFPTWPDGVNPESHYIQGQYIQHNGQLYRIQQPTVKPIESQPPNGEGMSAIYRPVDTQYAG